MNHELSFTIGNNLRAFVVISYQPKVHPFCYKVCECGQITQQSLTLFQVAPSTCQTNSENHINQYNRPNN